MFNIDEKHFIPCNDSYEHFTPENPRYTMTDEVSGLTATLECADGNYTMSTRNNTGVHLNGASQGIIFGNIFKRGRTYEIYVALMNYAHLSAIADIWFFTLSQTDGNNNVAGVLFGNDKNEWNMYSKDGDGWSTVNFDALGDRNGISGKLLKLWLQTME